jgi:hypothetical protein
MLKFTPFEYLLIDLANQYGKGDNTSKALDKCDFQTRLLWAYEHINELEELTSTAENPAMFTKTTLAVRDTQNGIPVGHLVGLDSLASGIQLLSVTTRCKVGMENTGLINTGVVPDPYIKLTNYMDIPGMGRAKPKDAFMTYMYGSEKRPKIHFGDLVGLFKQCAEKVAPHACMARNVLIDTWQSCALFHEFNMPNNTVIHLKTWDKVDTSITVPNLDKRSFTFRHTVNKGKTRAVKLAAHVTHSVDAFVVQEMSARCSYDRDSLQEWKDIIEFYVEDTIIHDRTKVCSLDLLEEMNPMELGKFSQNFLAHMLETINFTLEYKSFPVVFQHDEFKCHANNVQRMREQYNRIMWDLYHSDLLYDIIEQISGKRYDNYPFEQNVADAILDADYPIN